MEQEKLDEAFFDAVVNLDKEYCQRLLQQGADVECYNNLALHQMVEDGHEDMVHFLIENNADVNSVRGGDTALYTAINYGHTSIANYLIDNGADVTAERNAAIGIACQNQDFELVKKMISLGADTFTDFASNVSYAAMHSKESLRMVVEAYQESDPEKGLQKALSESIIRNDNHIAKTLLDYGVSPTTNNDNAFYQAVKTDNKEIVNYLIADKRMVISDNSKEWLNDLSDPSILGHESERYRYAQQLIEKRDLFEKLNQKPPRATQTKAKEKSQSFKHKI